MQANGRKQAKALTKPRRGQQVLAFVAQADERRRKARRAARKRARERLGVRLTHYSVQDSHLHLIVEAENSAALSRGVQGMKIRLAKRLNAMLGRVGQVFADRFHSHLLRTPAEIRNAINYVLQNAQKHARERGEWVPVDSIDGYASGPGLVAISGELRFLLPEPRTWLLAIGWKGAGKRRQ